MDDKLTKKRIKVDYKGLIKGKGLWFVYKQFLKERTRKTKSSNRLMYCFCNKYLRSELEEIRSFNLDLEDNIRIAKTPWLDEE